MACIEMEPEESTDSTRTTTRVSETGTDSDTTEFSVTTDTPCATACAHFEDCGVLVEYELTSSQCQDFCEDELSGSEADQLTTAPCEQMWDVACDLFTESTCSTDSTDTPCSIVCGQLKDCDILLEFELTFLECTDFCEVNATDSEANELIMATCEELWDAVYELLFVESEEEQWTPPVPYEHGCCDEGVFYVCDSEEDMYDCFSTDNPCHREPANDRVCE